MMLEVTAQRVRSIQEALVTSALVLIGVSLFWTIVWTELHSETRDVNWTVFAVIAGLLIVCERQPRIWIRFGPIGTVTPLWLFAYALLLLGSPSVGITVALLGSTLHSISQVESPRGLVVRVATTAISLSASALVLMSIGIRDAITSVDSMPWDWAVAIVLAGLMILVLNAVVAAIDMTIRRRISFVALLRRGLASRITAEGALVSLAPIWVIGIDFSLVLAPLLGVTTLLVFQSTRQALERSHEAHHDPLTGMLNRRLFLEHLDDALADPRPSVRTTILILDLNGFKEINDRLGHEIGDALLVAFADRLEHSRPPEALTARLGGDEFALLIVGDEPDAVIDAIVATLHASLSDPLTIEGFPISVGVSIGVAASPNDGRTRRDLLRAADMAMYKAKRTGNAVERYERTAKGPQRGRLNLLADLGTALERDQLHVHFQPQIRIADGSVDTIEALIRWKHPEHGLISPAEFVGLAEQTDLIGPITSMVIDVAARGMYMIGAPDVKLAVNVSARNVQDPYFASEVLDILKRTRFDPRRLELEVTESAIVTNVERSSYTIEKLRAAGVRIAIDDFGVGYSSYQTLRLLEADRVKIDRDFVQGLLTQPRDRMIVSSLTKLAHDLGLDVVAEGVESTALWNALESIGCDVAQGYGIAVPMPYPELRDWLANWGASAEPAAAAQHAT